jgi:hypothetical protein
MKYVYKVERTTTGRPMAMAGTMSKDGQVFWPLSIFHVANTVREAKRLARVEADEILAEVRLKRNE